MTMEPSPGDPDDDELDAQIEYFRAHVRDRLDDAGALAGLAGALLERVARAREAGDMLGARADVDEAIGWARAGLAVALPGDVELVKDLRVTLGIAAQERFMEWLSSDDGDPAGLNRARSDWSEAVTLIGGVLDTMIREDADDPGWMAEIEPFSGFLALGEALDPPEPEDRNTFVTWARWLFERVPFASSPPLPIPDEFDLRLRLAGEFSARADSVAGDRASSLQAAIAHLEALLPLIPDDDVSRLAALLVQLTLECAALLNGDATQYALVDQVVRYALRAWDVLDADDDDRPVIGLLLATGLHEQLIRPDAPPPAPETLSLAITVLSDVESRLVSNAEAHLTAEVLLGTLLVSRAQSTGSAGDLGAAARHLLRVAGELSADDPHWLDVTSHLAAAMTGLAHTGMAGGHFDTAIDLLRAVAGRITDPERGGQFRAALGLTLIARSFDHRGADIREGLEYLKVAHEMAPPGSPTRIWVALNLGSVLAGQFFVTGDRQHLKAARFYLDASEKAYRGVFPETGREPGVRDIDIPHLDAMLTANSGLIAMARAQEGDAAAAGEAVSAFRAALDLLPPGHPHAVKVRGDLGLARLLHAMFDDSPERGVATAWAAMDELDATARALPAGHLMRAAARLRAGGGLAACGLRAADPKAVRAGIDYLTSLHGELSPETEALIRCTPMLGFLYAELYMLTSDTADRKAALTWLGRAAAEFEREPGHPHHATLLARLARLHRADADGKAAARVGLSALRVRVRDVLMQTGTAHGLASARVAAADAVEIAGWCLDDKDPRLAVEALELGRGLVLHAATAVTTLPDLLAADGREDLAQEWRDQVRDADTEMPWESDSDPGQLASLLVRAPLAVPGDLRKRTLDGLAGSTLGDLLAPPGSRQIADALRLTSADALVYLLPSDDGRPGRALVVPADGGVPREIPLPLLTEPTVELHEYLAAHAELLEDPAAIPTRWRKALDALCEWAWPAVIERVLRAVPGDLPRLVLVPAGRLSLVPWHAARYRVESAGPRDGTLAASSAAQPVQRPPWPSGTWRYAVAEAVFSYAASGRQLVEVSRRPALQLSASPVVVADPTSSLDPAQLEARAIADRIYPGARYLGPRDAGDGRGTPEEVLAALPSAAGEGASMLHLACHANVSDGGPGRSHIQLADGQVLTVETILRRASGRPSYAAGGLVNLVACRSDLAAAHYDEALTLATAFLAAGACTVVGARWEILVKQSSVLAFMFHRFLVRDGLGPRDALRQAQLWMLDPSRPVPDEMPRELAATARKGSLAEATFWAAITHQGR